jgi:hypothetical protein
VLTGNISAALETDCIRLVQPGPGLEMADPTWPRPRRSAAFLRLSLFSKRQCHSSLLMLSLTFFSPCECQTPIGWVATTGPTVVPLAGARVRLACARLRRGAPLRRPVSGATHTRATKAATQRRRRYGSRPLRHTRCARAGFDGAHAVGSDPVRCAHGNIVTSLVPLRSLRRSGRLRGASDPRAAASNRVTCGYMASRGEFAQPRVKLS